MHDNSFLAWYPIAYWLLVCVVLSALSLLVSRHRWELEKKGASRAAIIPFAMMAGAGPLVAAFAVLYAIYLLAQVWL